MYSLFDYNEIKPAGWLKKQLEIQAAGLSGNLDKVWPDVRDSAWIGGERDGWERVPYWLDGFIPLAYLLDSDDMKARAKFYIDSILDRQQPDGWIAPCSEEKRKEYDVWAFFLIGKVLALYFGFTKSERAKDGLYRAMKCLFELLKSGDIELYDWGKFRWFEAFIPLKFLYDECGEDWIKELAVLLKEQGADYPEFYESWKTPLNKWTFSTHVVNIAMMLKYEAVTESLLGTHSEGKAEELYELLKEYNGTAVGTFTGDECLSGTANNQGTELCSVVELMYTFETLYRLTGDSVWAQRLEKVAFNALPATISDDMWTHQYDQMVNQIACETFPGKSFFRTNGPDAHLFGLELHCGCCTSNFNQGWPKLTLNTFLKTDSGILCAVMLPAKLCTVINGANVTFTTETDYPMRNSCKFTVKTDKAAEFEVKVRIPAFAENVMLNGKAADTDGYYTVNKVWDGEESFTISFESKPHLTHRPGGLSVLEYGSLVFSLPIKTKYVMHEYTKNNTERKFPYCDYELLPQSDWNYGFASSAFTVCENDGDETPFSSKCPKLTIKANLSKVNWSLADGYTSVAAKLPDSNRAICAPETIELYPYGCAKLRMTEMPEVQMESNK